jgi:hypothetical protein
MRNSLGTPHVYELSEILKPGKHTITVCIDNRTKEINPGVNSHSISDHTQTNWNGMVGRLFLEARPAVNIHNIQIFPDIQKKMITAQILVKNPTNEVSKISLNISVSSAGSPSGKSVDFDLKKGDNTLTMTYAMGNDVKLWNEFHPTVYKLRTILANPASASKDTCQTSFGMREFKAVGKEIHINGKPTFLRGTLECAIFPKTGCAYSKSVVHMA